MVKIDLDVPNSFFDEEIRNDFFVDTKRKELWAIELDLLTKLLSICEKHDLRVFADSGTLLGAVREKGFIAWDDDIDLVMFRKDYDQLIEVAEKEFSYPYFFQCAHSDEGYYRGHAQFRRSDTTAIIPTEYGKVPFNQGIFIDIFPLDYDYESQKLNRIRQYVIGRYKLFFKRVYQEGSRNGLKHLLRNIAIIVARRYGRTIYRSFEHICRGNSIKKVKKVDKVSYYWQYNQYRYLDSKLYNGILWMDFEFTKIPVPEGYHEILINLYGDQYMTPKRLPSDHQLGGDLIISTDISYRRTIEKKSKNILL